MHKELRLSGSGGQGVITAAIIFAEAATACGMNVAQSQSYGPEARGGALSGGAPAASAPRLAPCIVGACPLSLLLLLLLF